MGIKMIIFEDDPSESQGCLVQCLVLLVIVAFVGIWGYGKVTNLMKGPAAVRQERIESIEKEKMGMKEEIRQKQKEIGGPFAEEADLREAQKKLAELEQEKKNLTREQAEEDGTNKRAPDGDAASRKTSDSPVLQSLEGVSIPVSLVATEDVALLDQSGKETTLKAGAILRIQDRKARGTLSIESKNIVYVGNESRILGKVKVRQ